jgi:hypothetical protein
VTNRDHLGKWAHERGEPTMNEVDEALARAARVRPVHLFRWDSCATCFHEAHPGGRCEAPDEENLDPAVGGHPDNPPRACGCPEYVQMRGRPVRTEERREGGWLDFWE